MAPQQAGGIQQTKQALKKRTQSTPSQALGWQAGAGGAVTGRPPAPQPDNWGFSAASPSPQAPGGRNFAVPVPGGYSGPGGFVPSQQQQPPQQPRLVPGYPMPRDEMTRQHMLTRWNTRNRGVPAPDYLRQPLGGGQPSAAPAQPAPGGPMQSGGGLFPSPQPPNQMEQDLARDNQEQRSAFDQRMPLTTPEQHLQRFRDTRQALSDQRGTDALRGGVGSQRINGPGGINEDPSQTRMRNADGSIDRHYVYGGSSAMGAPGIPQGQVRVHPMLPGGAGVKEIPTPWVKKTGQVDPARVAASMERTQGGGQGKYPSEIREAAGMKADAKREQLRGYASAKREAIARRASEITQAGSGVLTTNPEGQALPNAEIVANANDRARGSLPFADRAANVQANAMQRGAARRERIENRQAVPSIEQRMAMDNPRMAIEQGRNQSRERMAEGMQLARLREIDAQTQGMMDVQRLENEGQNQPPGAAPPLTEEQKRIMAQQGVPPEITDPMERRERFEQNYRELNDPIGSGQAGGGGMIPGVPDAPQSVVTTPQETSAIARIKQQYPDPATAGPIIVKYAEQAGWSEQKKNRVLSELGWGFNATNPQGSMMGGMFTTVNPDSGEVEPSWAANMSSVGGLIGSGIGQAGMSAGGYKGSSLNDVWGGARAGGALGALAGYLGLPYMRGAGRKQQPQR